MKFDFPALFSPTMTVTPCRNGTSMFSSDLKPLALTRPKYNFYPSFPE